MLIQDFENSNEQIPFMVKIEKKNLWSKRSMCT